MSSQEEELGRVSARIRGAIMKFCKSLRGDKQFHAEDLRTYVVAQARVAPASADRVLRDMRQRGLINYEVISRSQSLYRLRPVAKSAAA